MPHLRFRAVDRTHVQKLSEILPLLLADAMETTEDNFTFESVGTEFFSAGMTHKSYPFVEVLWFERSQDVKTKSAKIITEQIKKLQQTEDVVVVFTPLAKKDYFENGKSY